MITNNKNLFLTLLLTLLVSLSTFSMDLCLPSLQAITDDFHVTMASGELTLSVYMFGFALSMLMSGTLSDRFGRRPIILFGIALHFISTVLCIFSPSIFIFIAGRFFQALGGCCGTVVARVIVRDKYPGHEAVRMLAVIAAGMTISPIIAPMIGGIIQAYFGWRVSFALLALVSFLLLIFAYFYLDESIKCKNKYALNVKEIIKSYSVAIKNKDYFTYSCMISLSWAGMFAYITSSAYLFVTCFKLTTIQYTWLYATIVISYIIGTILVRHLSKNIALSALVLMGIVICVAASCLFVASLFYFKLVSIVIPLCIYFIGVGMIMPTAQAAALAPFQSMIGSVAGLMYAVEMICGGIASFIVSIFYRFNHKPFVCIIIVASLLMLVLFYLTNCKESLLCRVTRPSTKMSDSAMA